MGMAVFKPFFPFVQVVFLLCLHFDFPSVADSVHGQNETDRLALLAFKAAITSDPFGALNSWNESVHFCQWVGVTCGRRHERVVVLSLDHQKLKGSISRHIGNMSFLRELWLRNNTFSQIIPPELGRLQRLRKISLDDNSLTGEIPVNISRCSNLVVLEFFGNRLVGEIPPELGSLTKLEGLRLGSNSLTGGLPSTIGNLSSLIMLYASDNNITGNIPDEFGRLNKLERFSLGLNNLGGTVPPSIFNLSRMTGIWLSFNQFQGSLPWDLGITLPNLQFLGVGLNSFTGSIPISLSNATKLYYISFTNNDFTGKVPHLEKLRDLERFGLDYNHLGMGEADDLSFLSSLTNATKLFILTLPKNNFEGFMPESISNLSANLGYLSLFGNNIYGNIPTGIGNLINLQALDMSINHLSGKILGTIGKLQNLQILLLEENRFSGEIPSSFANLTLLRTLNLSENNLHGSIPSSMGKCNFLEQLFLDHNNLSGFIPKEVVTLSMLLNLNLSHNYLSGSLPMEIGTLNNLETLDISQNMLVGHIPSSLGSCVKLALLKMEGNRLSGILPSTLDTLKGMEELDLSHNNFSGKIPDYFISFLFLKKLNLSFNDFEGTVPERGVFKNATAISVEGNSKLCGGIPELQLPNCHFKGSRRKAFILAIVIPISFGLVGLMMLFYFLYLCWFRKTREPTAFKFLGNPLLQLSYQSLLKATDGFSAANLIGAGSFGSVYKGILDEGQKVIAVKVLNLQFHGASRSFISECKALKSIKHRNLLKLITACSSIDYQGNDFKALVYEFMVNGSLEKWLHPTGIEDDSHRESRSLSLLQRLNIAVDVASALDYLHNHCSNPILHCDLKPSNILLDDEMVGHVGDFGLARFLRGATYSSSANQSSSIGIRGSVGYAAPEYGLGNEVSTCGDVYSYGILLLEMFTGKRPTDGMFSDSLTLHNFVKMSLPEKLADIVDPTIFEQREVAEEASSSINNTQIQGSPRSQKNQECLILLLKVGIACSEELPTDRLDINDVVTQLHAIRSILLETRVYRGNKASIVGHHKYLRSN